MNTKNNAITLPNEDVMIEFELPSEELNIIYQAALLENKITLKELYYQAQFAPRMTVKKATIAAFTLRALKELLENEEEANRRRKEAKSKGKVFMEKLWSYIRRAFRIS